MTVCFDGLSAASRRMRFFGIKPTLTETDLDFFTSADGRDHIALGVVRLGPLGEEIEPLGAGRCIRQGQDSDGCELAMAVIDAAQGRGVGTALLDALIAAASEQGFRRIHCDILASNLGMRALVARLDGQLRWHEGGSLEFDYELPPTLAEVSARSLHAPWALPKLAFEAGVRVASRALDLTFDLGRASWARWLERWPWSADSLPTESHLGHGRV
ncbi:GNAT family N-acetyltransferase [Thiorhodococcus fuscus]|uniref:GNAT family N-acetyltransferase n=1 Tax=Thiorhodococcus fuscus TaxID=527200 RepID=A0ABW4Y7Q6_9GAMM